MRTLRFEGTAVLFVVFLLSGSGAIGADEWWKPYRPPCVERENVFAFTEKPTVQKVGDDRYEIKFALKAACDVTVGIVDSDGNVVRHIGSGVLGANAPVPFQKNSLGQTLFWNGKDDLGEYCRTPGALKVRVSLGLKPEFDKFLGSTHPKNLPGYVWGIAASADAVYVFIMGRGDGHLTCRKFDHDANYIATIWPPPAGLPPEKLGGMGFVEYEPGKKAVQAPLIHTGTWRHGMWMPYGIESFYGVVQTRPAVAGNKIYLLSSGATLESLGRGKFLGNLHYLLSDGSTDYEGIKGRPWMNAGAMTQFPQLALSPDGKDCYMVGFETALHFDKGATDPVVLKGPTDGSAMAKVFVGGRKSPGSDDKKLNGPSDVACDSEGRVYVADMLNNRVQVFSPAGESLKTIQADRPQFVQVHQKTGAVYVACKRRQGGVSVSCVSKFGAFPALAQEQTWNIPAIDSMTLDSWSARPRLWIGAGQVLRSAWTMGTDLKSAAGLVVMEEKGSELAKVSDFNAESRQADGGDTAWEWGAGIGDQLACDPVRSTLYVNRSQVFDLKTGKLLGRAPAISPAASEIAFDKRGYMHVHMASGFPEGKQAIGRIDPTRFVLDEKGTKRAVEVPYDYGVERVADYGVKWAGVVPLMLTDHQLWTWGFGVNMWGDIAVDIHVEFAPKMEMESWKEANLTRVQREERGEWTPPTTRYETWVHTMAEQEKKGIGTYFIQREPGIPLTGGTVWTFKANGEPRERGAVVAGARNNGAQIDEDGKLYFTNARFRMIGDKPFLSGRGGNFGGEPISQRNVTPFTGAYMKTADKGVRFIVRDAKIAMDKMPTRPPDLAFPPAGSGGAYFGEGSWCWAEGSEWIYAGAAPIVAEHCDCPQMRASLDWYKRSFVPEAYRHSIGVLDGNGNLITHIGQYGNFDSGNAAGMKIKVDGDGIATTLVRYVSATDDYLCISDWAQRIIVAKLNYHAEETAAITVR